jgi:hypothetical protein
VRRRPFAEGELGEKLYIIETGVVTIQIGGKEVRRCGTGEHFG